MICCWTLLYFKELLKNMEETKKLTRSHNHINIDMHQRKHFQNENKKNSLACFINIDMHERKHFQNENKKNSLACFYYRSCRPHWRIQWIGMICHTKCSQASVRLKFVIMIIPLKFKFKFLYSISYDKKKKY